MPKFSFVIPVYQTKKYLTKCLDSLLCQTYRDFEIVLVDDGSDDGSEKICDLYEKKDNRIFVIHKNNEGQGEARNIGIHASKGENIIFVDSDDYWINSNSLMNISACIDSYDVVFFDLISVYDSKKYKLNITNRLRNEYKSGEEFLIDLLKINHSFPWFPVLYAFKKELWERNDIKFPKNTYFEDTGTIFKIPLMANSVYVLKENVYAYRRTRTNSTTKKITIKLLTDHINICDEAITFIKHLYLNSEISSLLCNNIACGFIDTLNHVYALNKNEYKEMIEILNNNLFMINYLKYGKQKYMSLFIKLFGVSFSTKVFGLIKRIKNSVI